MHVVSSAPSTPQRQLEALKMYTGSKGVHLRVQALKVEAEAAKVDAIQQTACVAKIEAPLLQATTPQSLKAPCACIYVLIRLQDPKICAELALRIAACSACRPPEFACRLNS